MKFAPKPLQQNGWTGGQYSFFRIIFGVYLLCHFVQLIPYGKELFSSQGMLPHAAASPILYAFLNILALCDTPLFVTLLLLLSALFSLAFALGFYDRLAALALWYVWACLFGRNPLIGNPSLPYVGLLLLAHACLPVASYGSWVHRKAVVPHSDWHMPPAIYLVVWALMALGYSYSGYTKLISPSWVNGSAFHYVLENPLARPGVLREWLLSLPPVILRGCTWAALCLELLFAPLALSRRLRPLLWSVMLLLHCGLIVLIDFADLSFGMVLLHLFTFDPAWIKPLAAQAPATIFYDGNCGLCHRAVRFFLAEDTTGKLFRFAPLQNKTFISATTTLQRQTLPDSIVIITDDKRLLWHSTAVLYLLKRLGGVWRLLACVAEIMPLCWRDAMYEWVAKNRHRLGRKANDVCPTMPAETRVRFDA